jgi:hypothetical protein
MPDITMCNGEGCPLKKTCYRFTAKPTPEWQSWFTEIPYDHENSGCVHYWQRDKAGETP